MRVDVDQTPDLRWAEAQLRAAGCVAAREEAAQLTQAAAGDLLRLAELVARRCHGEPLAWIVETVRFCDQTVRVCPGVYVPRPQTEMLALAAVARLPAEGLAVDLCTGCGAVALVLRRRRPSARVWATEIDAVAAACARANGVEVCEGDMAAPLPAELAGRIDVVTAVVPYVPSDELRLLARDVLAYEPRTALDGGADGANLLRRAAGDAAVLLRRGGFLLLELGGEQADLLRPLLDELGFSGIDALRDAEGDARGLVCRLDRPATAA